MVKISIVMGYINRKQQLRHTLKSIESSKHKDYEIIIANDDVDDNLQDIVNEYNNIVVYQHTKEYNPCMTFNYGLKRATGDIVIIQNPECVHACDIMDYTIQNLKNNDYIVYNCLFFESFEQNEQLYSNKAISPNVHWFVNNHGWAVHHEHNIRYLHFCSAIHNDQLKKIGYFSEKYKDGYCFDDDEFFRKIQMNKINYYIPVNEQIYVIHQHHDRQIQDSDAMEKWKINKYYYISDHKHLMKTYLSDYVGTNIYDQHYYRNNKFYITVNIHSSDIYYAANLNNMIIHDNIKKIFDNATFEITFDTNIFYYVKINDIRCQIINGKCLYRGKISNILNGLEIYNCTEKTQISNISIKVLSINYDNSSCVYIEDNKTFLYDDVPRHAYTYIKDWQNDFIDKINNFMINNPDWLLTIYYFDDIDELLKINDDNIILTKTFFSYDTMFIYNFKKNKGLWFNIYTVNLLCVKNVQFNQIFYHKNMYKNDLIINNNTQLYNYIFNNYHNDSSFDSIMKKLFNSPTNIEEEHNIPVTNYIYDQIFQKNHIIIKFKLLINNDQIDSIDISLNDYQIESEKEDNASLMIITKYKDSYEKFEIINDKIYNLGRYDEYAEFEIIGNVFVMKWSNGVINYYIYDQNENIYVMQIIHNFNYEDYNKTYGTNLSCNEMIYDYYVNHRYII